MLNTLYNSAFCPTMDLFEELQLDIPGELLMRNKINELDCMLERYQELQDKYSSLHETYAKEIEGSQKVKKSLAKCLKFYSKLCKKYEAQQKIIDSLKESIKQKMNCLEESLKNQEKLKGLIQIYKSERTLYSAAKTTDLIKDKEILLDICCKLISESVKTSSIKAFSTLILRKFKKDLDDEKVRLLKCKEVVVKKENRKSKDEESVDGVKKLELPNGSVSDSCKHESDCKCYKDEVPKTEEVRKSCEIFEMSEKLDNEEIPPSNIEDIMESIPPCLPLLENDFESSETSDLEDVPSKQKSLEDDFESSETSDLEDVNSKQKSNGSYFRLNDEDERNTFGMASLDSSSTLFDSMEELILKKWCQGKESSSKTGSSERFSAAEVQRVRTGNALSLPSLNSTSEDNGVVLDEQNDLTSKESTNVSLEKSKEDGLQKMNVESDDSDQIIKNEMSDRGCDHSNHSQISAEEEKPKLNGSEYSVSSLNISAPVIDTNHSCGTNMRNWIHLVTRQVSPEAQPVEAKSNSEFSDNVYHSGGGGGESGTSVENPLKVTHSIFDVPSGPQYSSGFTYETKDLVMSFDSSQQNDNFRLNPSKNLNNKNVEECEDKDFVAPEDLSKIFDEMAKVRLLSPIREIKPPSKSNVTVALPVVKSENPDEGSCGEKRNSNSFSETSKNKKLKSSCEGDQNFGILDSIMSAMSLQNEKFKCRPIRIPSREEVKVNESVFTSPEKVRRTRSLARKSWSENGSEQNGNRAGFSPPPIVKTKRRAVALESLVMKEIKNFVSSSITSKEDAEKQVKFCLSVLSDKPEDIIAKSMVTIVFENINEEVENFGRPAPPLTRTQHRLVVLLSALKTFDARLELIPSMIMSQITQKLFGSVSWPDDIVETVTRFYAALCKTRNEVKTLWKFCLQAMTEMRQRSCLVVFTVLKMWPDILHEAPTLRNNILAVSVVNVFLHMSKTDGLNWNQRKKLMALKHLLMNFYQFKVDDTIESFTQKVLDSVLANEVGAEKSLVLLSKCRDWTWTGKVVLPKLKAILVKWHEGKVEESAGSRLLSVLEQIFTDFSKKEEKFGAQTKELISCLCEILTSKKMSHTSEVKIIEILLEIKHDPEIRKVIHEWKPKEPIDDCLRNEIINVPAENILREFKMNRRKDGSEKKKKNKNKNSKKRRKLKGKKKNGSWLIRPQQPMTELKG